jgi:cohesin domain-containing protein/dockerin type I repeat protein/putative Ig domain-containing protein/Big-like domain-containing protein
MAVDKGLFLRQMITVVFTVLLIAATSAFGQSSIRVVSTEAAPGSDVTVKIEATTDRDIGAVHFDLAFDSTLLQIKETTKGADAGGVVGIALDIESANSSGVFNVDLADFTLSAPMTAGENKKLFAVIFTIASDAAEGEVAITLANVSLSDTLGVNVPATAESGVLNITSEPMPEPPLEGNAFWVVDTTGMVEADVTVRVMANLDQDIGGAQFDLGFDPAVFQIKETSDGADAGGVAGISLDIESANSSGILQVDLADLTLSEPMTAGENKELFAIIFTISTDAPIGEVEITLADPSLSDTGGVYIPVTVLNGMVNIIPAAINQRPRWQVPEVILDLTEGEEFSYTFNSPIDDDFGDELVVEALNLPEGAVFDPENLSFNWTPGLEAEGIYEFVLVAIDRDGAKAGQVVVLAVKNVNQPPELHLPEEIVEIMEGEFVSFTIRAFDPDFEPVAIEAPDLPEGAFFADPVFTWAEPAEGEYTITFTATDPGGLSVTREVVVKVIGINDPPVFEPVPDVNVEAGEQVTVELTATDPDDDELHYALLVVGENNIIDRGAVFSGNTLSWTPAVTDIGPNILVFVVQDPEGLEDRVAMNITVTGRNIVLPPCFEIFQAQEIEEEEALVFVPGFVNPSTEGYRFWVDGLPEGAEFDSTTGTLSWTPNLFQAGLYVVTFGVSDGSFQDMETLELRVAEKDVMPVLSAVGDLTVKENSLLKVNLQAEDASGEGVTFDADSLPDGAQVFPGGLFKFRPGFEQAGSYSVTIYAFDASGNYDEETITLTVEDLNRKPELVVDNQAVSEGDTLQFDITATDPDGDELSYAAYDLPSGAVFDETTGSFNWITGQDQSGNYLVLFTTSDGKSGGVDSARAVITVGDVNRPPELDPIGNQVVEEGDTLTFEITASDLDNTDQLSVSISGLPEVARFSYDTDNPVTVTVVVIPDYLDAGIYDVRVTAGDNNAQNPLSVSRRFELEIKDTDVAPSFTGQLEGTDTLALTVNEGGRLEIEVRAQDPGGDALSYSTSILPKNARTDFTGLEKLVIFAPGYDQSGTHKFELIASDGANTVSKPVKVQVTEVNLAPVVFEIDDQSVDEGDIITFAVNYHDPDNDSVIVHTDAARVPFLTLGDTPPASIRDGNVFVFDTDLVPDDEPISSAVFFFWAEDVRGGQSEKVRVEIAVLRNDSTEIPELASGQEHDFVPPGFSLQAKFKNNSGGPLQWLFKFMEKSGFLQRVGQPTLVSAGNEKVKAEGGVYAYLAADGSEGDFYSLRRGWGLDLSSQELVEGTEIEVILEYFEEDLPTEILNFTEERLSVFGYDPDSGWLEVEDAVVDTVANQATFSITDYSIVDYTIGAVLDIAAPVITDLKVIVGIDTVAATGADSTSDLDGPYEFRVNITDDEIISDAVFYYSIKGSAFEEIEMTHLLGNLFSAQVSGPLTEGSSISYYIIAQDEMNTVSLPAGAPDEVYQLVVPGSAVPGDVDGSGSVNIFDLLELLQVLSGAKESSTSSDVNGDGSTNIFDLLSLLGILAG